MDDGHFEKLLKIRALLSYVRNDAEVLHLPVVGAMLDCCCNALDDELARYGSPEAVDNVLPFTRA